MPSKPEHNERRHERRSETPSKDAILNSRDDTIEDAIIDLKIRSKDTGKRPTPQEFKEVIRRIEGEATLAKVKEKYNMKIRK
jgi:hypothetical protein